MSKDKQSAKREGKKKLGKYTILDVAGRGGMGTVYKGHDPVINRPVAIKVYTTSEVEFGTEIAMKMFLNEAQVVGALDHPNIMRIYDAGEFKGRPYIAMEFVEGLRTLGPHCQPDDLLPIETVVRLMQQSADALHYAHGRDVIHRDIKPENIMLTPEDEVKIVDFGVAERKHVQTDDTYQAVGTPSYMSPEQAQGDAITGQSDLYSLGVTMYQMLTGTLPFKANGIAALAVLIASKDARPIRELRPEVPAEVEAIVKRAMSKCLDTRYKTGEQMSSELATAHAQVSRKRVELTPKEQFATARELSFFQGFSDVELKKVLEVATWEFFAAGEILVTESAKGASIFVLVSGDVDVQQDDCPVCTLSTGECVGELSYISDEAHTASVVTRNDVSALKIDAPVTKWGSIPVQMRFNDAFQRTLVERLKRTTRELGKFMKEATG